MYELVNLVIVAAIGVCLYVAYYRNLFQCALLLGKCLFALLLAMALFEPLARIAAQPLGLAMPYANAAAFFLIWVVVLLAFERLALQILKADGRGMRFRYELPGQLVIGLVSGLLASFALSAGAVTVPQVEGVYFKNGAQPVGQFHRKAAWLFGACTLTSGDPVTPAQMEAGYYWLKARLSKRGRSDYNADVEELVPRFEERYKRAVEPKELQERRQTIVEELKGMLAKRLPREREPAPEQPAPAPTGETSQQPRTEQPAQPPAPAEPAFDLTSVQDLVRKCRFEQALTSIAQLKERYREPRQAEWLRREEERLRSLQQIHEELVRTIASGDRRQLPLPAPGGGIVVDRADSEKLWLQDSAGQPIEHRWDALDEATLLGIFQTYLPLERQKLQLLREELLIPNAVQVDALAREVEETDRQVSNLGSVGLLSREELRGLTDRRIRLAAELLQALDGTGRQHRQRRQDWSANLQAGREPWSPQMLRLAVTMQETVRAVAPILKFLSHEQVPQLFGDHLGIYVGKAVLMTYVLIGPGEFAMGSPAGASYAQSDESPSHRVKITRPFFMAIHETTAAQYEAVTGEQKETPGPDYPVVEVSWEEAAKFCGRLSELTGLRVLLPTEAEWEYACRAGSTGPGPTGPELDELAWHGQNSGGRTHPSGSRQPNAWGLKDMLGNVAEWCRDWYAPDSYKVERTATNPTGPPHGTRRVARSGMAKDDPRDVRPANRLPGLPTDSAAFVGFRTVIELGP